MRKNPLVLECRLPIPRFVTLNSYLVLFVAKHMLVLQMLSSEFSDTRVMGRFLDVVSYNLSVIFSMGQAHTFPPSPSLHT